MMARTDEAALEGVERATAGRLATAAETKVRGKAAAVAEGKGA